MKLSSFSMAFTIVGAYIGAGFVSGQELWQFFGVFGLSGLVGFAIAILTICILSGATLHFVSITGRNTFDKVVTIGESKFIKGFINVFQFAFYLGIYVIMCAGVQSLVEGYFETNKLLVGIAFCILVTAISLIGVKGITAFFSAVIPILVISTVIIAVYTFATQGIAIGADTNHNSLVTNWFVSSIVFVSYNFFAGIGVFAVVGKLVKSNISLIKATFLAFMLLSAIGFSIILSVSVSNTQEFDMPMLQVAYDINPFVSYFYALLLLFAMLGAAISSLVPFTEWFKVYFPNKRYLAPLSATSVSAITVFLSLFGFSDLIGTVYPIFGYTGSIITVFVIYNLFSKKHRCKNE